MQPAGASRALALAVWPERVSRLIQALLLVIGGTLILTLSAKIQVPFYPVPMTLQTLGVMAIAAAYGSRLAVATVVLYLIEGFVGLPVFAGAAAGPLYLIGPTGGFLAGFVVLAFIVGTAVDRGWDRSAPKLFATLVAADVVVFAMGFAWLAWAAQLPNGHVGTGMAYAWSGGLEPFILGDLLKIVLTALAVPATWLLVDRK